MQILVIGLVEMDGLLMGEPCMVVWFLIIIIEVVGLWWFGFAIEIEIQGGFGYDTMQGTWFCVASCCYRWVMKNWRGLIIYIVSWYAFVESWFENQLTNSVNRDRYSYHCCYKYSYHLTNFMLLQICIL